MKKLFSLLSFVLFVLVFNSFASSTEEKKLDVIYGDDNRMDVFESTFSDFVTLSKSTAAMIPPKNLKALNNNEVEVFGGTLESRGICEKEKFSQQITAANCSGFIVAPNILVTAGHCIKSQTDCASHKWVFDYKVQYTDQSNVVVPATSVYSCKKIIARSLDQLSKDDYAVIELDRNVQDRKPLTFRRKGKITGNTSVAVIGHPTGLPTKIADGAKVRSLQAKFFVTNLDTYGGNSGSAVFNVKTKTVEGILVRGENDYVPNPKLGCKVSKVCTNEGCRGEDVTYITNVDAIKNIR